MKKNGFTLIELLMSVTILSGIVIVLSQSFFATTRGSIKSGISSDVKQGGDFSLRIMEQMIRSSIGDPSSCDGVAHTSLSLTAQDGSAMSFGCVYDGVNNITRIASVSAAGTSYISQPNITLGGTSCADQPAMTLQFICTKPPGDPSSIQIKFSLSQKGTPVDQFQKASLPFQSTFNVRN